MLLKFNLIVNKIWLLCFMFFGKFFIFFHIFKLLALDFRDKNLIFSMGFLEEKNYITE